MSFKSFVGKLADQIESQFSLGENDVHTLDEVIDGKPTKYGSLGEFATQIDQSAQRKYLEEGYLRRDAFNIEPMQMETLLQEPNATILIKKRMFSSLGEHFRPDYMNDDEKLYLKTMKILFDNKAKQISALERLSKIQKISEATGDVNKQLMPMIFGAADLLGGSDSESSLFGSTTGFGATKDASALTKALDRLRRLYSFNTTNLNTTWIKDDSNPFQSTLGQGTGVIEITNFTSFTTTVSTKLGGGRASISIFDPYNAMTITESDIEKAISDATNSLYNHKIFQFGEKANDDIISNNLNRLNQLRSERKVGGISIKVNPDTLLGKRVTAIVDRTGQEIIFNYDSSGGSGVPGLGVFGDSVTVADSYLINGNVLGIDGLDNKKSKTFKDSSIKKFKPNSELSIFKDLITAIYTKIAFDANSKNATQTSNKKTNYTRRKLRFNFSGKSIIQAMDVVHIYISSKPRYDNKLLSGLENQFSGYSILQNINKTATDFKNAFDSVFNPGGNVDFQIEKSAYVGDEFPNYLWSMVRDQFVTEKEGTHVFAGIVSTVTSTDSPGSSAVTIEVSDNSKYFTMGKTNFKPGVDAFNGSIYDPLTIFESNFDSITSNVSTDLPELLQENKILLGSSQEKDTPLVKFKLGPNAGAKITQDNYVQDRSVDARSGIQTKVIYAADGMVNKWKEGIGVTVQFGSSLDLNDPHKVGATRITNNPFAGQSVMNVLSLLVTGTPYDFASYWKATSEIDGQGTDPQSLQSAAHSFSTSLQNSLKQTNSLWGNFIPFKNLVMDEQSYILALKTQSSILKTNNLISENLKKLDSLAATASVFGFNDITNLGNTPGDITRKATLNFEYQKLSETTNALIRQVSDQNQSYFAMTGDDVSFDTNNFLSTSPASKTGSDPTIRKQLRKKINFLTKRNSYAVRGNEDKNLFIVDDFYDKDYDMSAFEKSLAGISLYSNDFTDTLNKIQTAAGLLNLEVFCDTQGHVRVRPPQYNRMPSSVFQRMMYLKKTNNIQVFPEFLNDLFSNQLKTLKERIEIVEDQIRLDCAALDLKTDESASAFINQGSVGNVSGSPFAFISNVVTGAIGTIDDIIFQANQDLQGDQSGQDFVSIKDQANSTKDIFSPAQRFTAIISSYKSLSNPSPFGIDASISNFENDPDEYVNNLIKRLQSKTGVKITRDFFVKDDTLQGNGVVLSSGIKLDLLKITKDIADKVSERQKVLKLFYNAIKSSAEFKSLDDDSRTGTSLIFDGNQSNSHIPEVFEHMIEDELYDDYGTGSGKRFIIKNNQIKSLSINEQAPPYTMVEVQGNFNQFASDGTNPVPGLTGAFEQGGNALVTATAVDYDMWRNWGLLTCAKVYVPFLSDANSQCAPYASVLLSIARKNVLRGSVTLSGNEFMQPGEVVFIDSRGLLFYVESVNHSFSNGKSFQTTLELSYGHTPGEYIPTTVDVIGKLIYNNKDISAFEVQRQSSSGNDVAMGVIQRETDSSSVFSTITSLTTDETNKASNGIIVANSRVINNILFKAAQTINSNNAVGNSVIAKLQLRIYYDDNNPINEDLLLYTNEIKQAFINGTLTAADKVSVNVQSIQEENISIEQINLSNSTETRSPSQGAMDMVRNLSTKSFSDDLNESLTSYFINGERVKRERDKLRVALYKYIIDCWVQFEAPTNQVSGS